MNRNIEAIGSGEGTIRLEDIAQQLSHLAQRERDSASIMPYEPPRARDHDRDTLTRILSRIDSNERQAVEAFTAVNQRLSVLGRQIATSAKPKSFDKPEDVPGFYGPRRRHTKRCRTHRDQREAHPRKPEVDAGPAWRHGGAGLAYQYR